MDMNTEADSTSQRILQAARRLFAQRGFKGTTTRAIALEASVNEVSIFRIWGSKEALLAAILNSSLPSEENAPLARILDREIRDLDGLIAVLADFMETFYCRLLPGVDDLLQIALKESGERPEYLRFFTTRTKRLAELLGARLETLEGGLLGRGASRLAADSILKFLIGRSLMVEPAEEGPPDFEALARLYVRGLAA